MKKWLKAALLCILSLFLLTGCSSRTDETDINAQDGKLKVVVSFNAMKEFAEAVGKDNITVITLIPDGTEPHDFQPTTKSLKALSHADVFIYNGLGMEPWAAKAIEVVENDSMIAVDASQGVPPISLAAEKDSLLHHHGHNDHHAQDPHCWLSLSCAQIEVQNIADAFSKADPAHADLYQQNAAAYKAQLQQLLDAYQEKFASIPNTQFVTGHAAFAYLCRDFHLNQNSVESVFAGGEPSTQQMAKLVEYCKAHHVKTIFTEDMVSPKTSQTLAHEVGASVQSIHTLESGEGNASYLDRMAENLEKIYTSLQ